MASYRLNQKDIYSTLLFWYKNYIKFKLMTLNIKDLPEEEIRKTIYKIDASEKIEDVFQLVKKVKNVYGYALHIKKFIEFLLKNIERIEDIDVFLVLDFLSENTIGKNKATKENYKNNVINFLRFIEDNNREKHVFNLRQINKFQQNFKNLKNKLPDHLTEEEMIDLLNAIESHIFVRRGKKSNKKGNKNDNYLKTMYRLAIKFAMMGGLRISEIANLKLTDLRINEEKDFLIINIKDSKNSKSRLVPIAYSKGKFTIKKDLEEFLREREKVSLKMQDCKLFKEDYLFVTYECKKISASTMHRVLGKLFQEAGLFKTKNGMHILRHTYATYFHKHNPDTLTLQKLMGHSNIQTTLRYTHIDNDLLEKGADVFRR